ncbi:MAG: HAD-superfamily hydrolase, subfamily variant 3 [Bryobacterales bacterium]|nr:HAD-superfamily hydrolase, subfamily variant 3 [Bryobacterales bacterium]
MIPRFPVYLFDIDGTLLDSAVDICGAVQQAVVEAGHNAPPFDYLKGFIGHHLRVVFADIFPACSPEQMETLIQSYRAAYPARGHRETRLYPGVAEALPKLGGRKSTATTKGTATARVVLEKFGLLPYFDDVMGTDGIPCKPEPDVILAAMRGLGATPSECLMVGDAPTDMEAGRKAGVKLCAVRYGYGKPEDLARFEPDYWISDLRELLN